MLTENIDSINNLISSWINGDFIKNLRLNWQEIFKENEIAEITNLNIFIENALNYKYPWGVSSFLQILCTHLNIKYEELGENIKNLSSFIKYGVNKIPAIWARSIGLNSRPSALKFAEIVENYVNITSFEEFIKWFAEIDENEISDYFNDLNIYEKNNILNISQSILSKPFLNTYQEKITEVFYAKGIPYSSSRKRLSKIIKINDKLELIREENNIYDFYAVKIVFNEEHLGYVPKSISKKIALGMDLDGIIFDVNIEKIIPNRQHNELLIKIQEM